MKRKLTLAALGMWLGATLTAVGFADYGEVRRMMRLQDLRLHFTFAGAILLAGAAFVLWVKDARARGRRISPRTVIGAALFGVGWGLSCTCPAGVLVQLAAGYAPALAVLVATLAGIALADWAEKRFGWSRQSCDRD